MNIRIIPRLDIKGPNLVGIQMEGLRIPENLKILLPNIMNKELMNYFILIS